MNVINFCWKHPPIEKVGQSIARLIKSLKMGLELMTFETTLSMACVKVFNLLNHKHVQLTVTFQKQQWELATQLNFQVRQLYGTREQEEQQRLETPHELPKLQRPVAPRE